MESCCSRKDAAAPSWTSLRGRCSSKSVVARAGVPAFDFTVSELLAVGDRIFAVVRGHEDWNESAELNVVDAVTGKPIEAGGALMSLGMEVVVPPAANGKLFVTGSGQVIALDAADGNVVWRTRGLPAAGPHEWPLLAPVRQGPAVLDGRVYVASNGQLAALDEQD
jgi:outer membrane protein assembly factor BamB